MVNTQAHEIRTRITALKALVSTHLTNTGLPYDTQADEIVCQALHHLQFDVHGVFHYAAAVVALNHGYAELTAYVRSHTEL